MDTNVSNVRFGNYSIGNSNARQLKGEQKPAEEKSAETKQNQNVFINPDKAMDVLAAQGMMNMAQIELVSKNEEKPFNPSTFLKDAEEVMGYEVSKYVAKFMLENKKGNIVNITSNNAINQYDPSTLEYDASKAGIISLTHNLAVEFAPYINVNAVAPGWVMTEKVKELNDSLDGMLEQEESKKILIHRFTYPEEVANLVYFLTTDEARSINNQVITIDGGTR